MLKHGMTLYDALYTWCHELTSERQHGDPEQIAMK